MNSKKPNFSILITTYNSALSIRASMNSILSQIGDDDDFEVVVVDSYSTDGTEEYLKHLASAGKIRLISVRCNRGEGRQTALERAKGKYVIARLDMDTVYNNIIRPIAKFLLKKRKELKKDFVLHAGPLFVSTKEFLLIIGGWKDLQWGENYELNKRLIDKGVVYLCPVEEAKFHVKTMKRSSYQKLKTSFYTQRDSLRMGLKVSTLMKGLIHSVRNPFAGISRCYFMLLLAYPLHFLKNRYDTFKNTDWEEYYILDLYSDKLSHFEELFPDKVFPTPESLKYPKMKNVFVNNLLIDKNKILDVGCGSDARFKARPRGFVNCDMDKPSVKIPNFVRCDARKLPFKDEAISYVLMYNVLEHVKDYKTVLVDGLRVSKKGIIARVDGFITLRNLVTFDHEYLTLGMKFVKTPKWLEKIRNTVIFNPHKKTEKKVYKLVHRLIKILFRIVLRSRYFNYYRSWHYYLVSKDGSCEKLSGDVI